MIRADSVCELLLLLYHFLYLEVLYLEVLGLLRCMDIDRYRLLRSTKR